MSCPSKVSKPCIWIKGSTTVKELIGDIVDEMVNATIPSISGGVEDSKWEISYREREHNYVTYKLSLTNRSGRYIHTDKVESVVYKVPSEPSSHVADDGYVYESVTDAPLSRHVKDYSQYRTGKKVSFSPFEHEGVMIEIENALVTLIDMHPNTPVNMFDEAWEKYQAFIVKHTRIDYLGNEVEDGNWNYFKIVAPLPNDWTYAIHKGSFVQEYYMRDEYRMARSATMRSSYTVSHCTFTPTYSEVPEKLVLECRTNDQRKYNVYFEKPINNNNYIKIQYGMDILHKKNLIGEPEKSYQAACDLNSIGKGKTPVIIDEHEAYKAYERQENNGYEQGELMFNNHVSPSSYWFFSRNSTENWMPVKMRGPESVVRYFISFNNDRALIVLEGDPSFEHESYYRSFAYIGKFNVLDSEDTVNNFAITVGMGDSGVSMTGFTYNNINKKTNQEYALHGRYTSNGMDTVSVLRGKSNLSFQEYLPSFLTHLPNYPNVGTLPKGVGRLELNDHLFQPSIHTNHIHSSPVYLVNGYEGYRGYLDGIVAIYDQHMLNEEELEYEVGEYEEIYKYFKINSHINFLNRSPSPGNTSSIAILKEIKRRS